MDQTDTLVRRLARMAVGGLARRMRRLADTVLEVADPPSRVAQTPVVDPLGPPAHWVEKVRHAAPELLLPLAPRRSWRSPLRTGATPPHEPPEPRPPAPVASTRVPSPKRALASPPSLGLGSGFASAPLQAPEPAVRWPAPRARAPSPPLSPRPSATPSANEPSLRFTPPTGTSEPGARLTPSPTGASAPGPRLPPSPTEASAPGPEVSPEAMDPREHRALPPRGGARPGVDPPAPPSGCSRRPAFAHPPRHSTPIAAEVRAPTFEALAAATGEPSPPVPFVAPRGEEHPWPVLPAYPGPWVEPLDDADPWRRARRLERELRGG